MHPYHPDLSPAQQRGSRTGHSPEGLWFWYGARLALTAALWVYYVNFPLLFHPVNILKKFGFSCPVGVVIDEAGHVFVRRSLSQPDYESFKEYSTHQEAYRSIQEWVRSHPDLTDQEIRSTWNEKTDGDFPGLWEGYSKQMAKIRALRAAMAYSSVKENEIPESLINDAQDLEGWKRLMRRRNG